MQNESREEKEARRRAQDKAQYKELDLAKIQITFEQYRFVKRMAVDSLVNALNYTDEQLKKERDRHEAELKKLRVRMCRLELKAGVDLVNPEPYVEPRKPETLP